MFMGCSRNGEPAKETEDEELNAGCGPDIFPRGATIKSCSEKNKTQKEVLRSGS